MAGGVERQKPWCWVKYFASSSRSAAIIIFPAQNLMKLSLRLGAPTNCESINDESRASWEENATGACGDESWDGAVPLKLFLCWEPFGKFGGIGDLMKAFME
jgi:hypothetical protein